jgi:hypothetical protein
MKKKNLIFLILNDYLKSQKGLALMATLIFVFVLTTFGLALLAMTRNDIKLAVLQEESTKAFYLADAGVERAVNWLTSQGTPPRAEDVPPVNLDGEHVFDELETGKYNVHLYVDPDQASTVAGYTIEAEGWIPNDDGTRKASRKIKTLVTITNFAEYAYFSDEERFPNNSNISGSGGYAGQVIWFTGNDEFGGKLHSNSQLHIVDVPIFNGKVTSTEETIDFWGNEYEEDGQDFPGFMDQYELGVDYIELPQYRDISDLDNEKSLQRIAGGTKAYIENELNNNGVYIPNTGGAGTEATAGIYVKGNATIDLDVDSTSGSAGPNSQITINQGGSPTVITSVKEPKTLPAGSTLNDIYYAGGTTIPTNTTLIYKDGEYESYNGLTNGLLFVDGAINGLSGNNHRGKMSIASTESITITEDIYYYDRDKSKDLFEEDVEDLNDSLGLIAAKDVEIGYYAPNDIEIDAIIMALNTSFFYERWQDRLRGTLSLLGGLIQKQRGPVGTHNAGVKVTGYSKNYNFDPRMANPASGNLPPYFPSTGEYQKIWWKEVY